MRLIVAVMTISVSRLVQVAGRTRKRTAMDMDAETDGQGYERRDGRPWIWTRRRTARDMNAETDGRPSLRILKFNLNPMIVHYKYKWTTIWIIVVYASKFLTFSEISLPSAFPASSFEAKPITFPISLIEVAPVFSMIALMTAVNSSSPICWGR